MAWRDIGLGWVFGAKDKGAQKQVEGLADGMERLDDGVKSVNTSARMNKLSAFIASVSLAKLGSIADKLDDIGSSAGSAQMTTGLEQTMIGFDKVSSVAGASMGMAGKALGKFKKDAHSMAYSLNTDIGGVVKAFQAVHASRLNIKELGLEMKDLVKIQEVTGVDAEKLVDVYKSLQSSYGLTAKQSKNLLDQIVAQGQAMGFGVEMFQQVPDILSKMDEAFAATLKEEGPEAIYKTMKAISMLGSVAQKTMGGTIPENTAMAMQVFEKLSGAEDKFRKMTSGLAQYLPEFYEQMSLAGVDVTSIFKLMKDDPLEFTINMRKMIKAVRETGDVGALDRLKKTVRDLGPQFTVLVEQTGSVGAEIDKMLASSKSPVRNAENALRDLARSSYKTGLSIDDHLSRIRESFSTKFNLIARKDAWLFVKRQRRTFGALAKTMQDLGKDKGPMGTLIRRFSLMRQVGIGAIFPLTKTGQALGGFADIAIDAAGDAVPAITALGSMGLKFGDVKKAIGKLGKPFGIFGKMLRGLPGPIKTVMKMVGPLGLLAGLVGIFGKDLESLFSKLASDIPRFILKYIFKMPAKDLKKMETPKELWLALGGKIWSAMKAASVWVYEKVTTGIGLFGDLLKSAGDWLQKQDWKKIFGNAFTWIGNAFLNLGDFIIDTVTGLWEGLWGWLWGDDSQKEAKTQIDGMEKGFGEKLGDGVESAISGIGGVVKGAIKSLFTKMWDFWSDDNTNFGEKIVKAAKVVMSALAVGMMFSPRLRSRIFGSLKNVFGRSSKMLSAHSAAACAESQAAQSCMAMGVAGRGMGAPVGGGFRVGPRTAKETGAFAKMPAATRAAMGRGGGMAGMIPMGGQMGGRGGMLRSSPVVKGFKKMGGAARGFAKSMAPALKGMGSMVATYGGMLALSGAFDPMLEKLGMTEQSAKATTNILGGAGVGFSIGGPIGAGIGAIAGLIKSLAEGLSKTAFHADNVTKTVNTMAASMIGDIEGVIPWAERLKNNVDLQEVLKENEALANINESLAAARAGRMIEIALNSAKATANTYFEIAKSYGWSADEMNRALEQTSKQVSELMENLFGLNIEAKKIRGIFTEEVGLGLEVKSTEMIRAFEKAQETLDSRRNATTVKMKQQALDQFKIMAVQASNLRSYLNRLEEGSEKEQELWLKLQPTVGRQLDLMEIKYSRSRQALLSMGLTGEQIATGMVGKSWAIDIASGFAMIADKAGSAEKAFTGVMREGGKPVLAETARKMVDRVRATVKPTTVPTGRPGVGVGGSSLSAAGTNDEGTRALITALVSGFGNVVAELQRQGSITKPINVTVKGGRGVSESGTAMGAYA